MKKRFLCALVFSIFFIGVLSGCNLSASKAPTAFSFPTPDLTGTAIYSTVATSLALTSVPMGEITETSAPSSTSTPVSAITATMSPNASPTQIYVPVITATSTPVPTIMPSITQLPTNTSLPMYRSVGKIVASYLQVPPTIDGNLDKWTLTQYSVNYVVFGKDDWVDPQDLSASLMVGWDDNNLYLGVHVMDSRYMQGSTWEHMYLGDSLEILLDTNLSVDFYVDKLSPDDFQLGISPGSPEPGDAYQAYLWFPSSIKGKRPQVRIASTKVEGGYDVEVAVPWNLFETIPVAGSHYGFAFSVSDNDNRNENLQQSMVSSVPNRRLTDPTTWGDILLGNP